MDGPAVCMYAPRPQTANVPTITVAQPVLGHMCAPAYPQEYTTPCVRYLPCK